MSSSSARSRTSFPILLRSYVGTARADQCAARQRSVSLRASVAKSRSAFSAASNTLPDLARAFARRRARTRTSAVPAEAPTTIAAAGRTQLRGSCMAPSSHASSWSAAASVSSTSVVSSRSTRSSGGSTGASARLSRASKSGTVSLIGLRGFAFLLHQPFELPDGAVNQNLRRAVGPAECPRDLAVVHSQREAHDQCLAAVVRKLLDRGQHALQLVAPLDQRLGVVWGGNHPRVLHRRLR